MKRYHLLVLSMLVFFLVAVQLPAGVSAARRRVRGAPAATPPAAATEKKQEKTEDGVSAAMKMVGAAMAKAAPKPEDEGPAPPPSLTRVGNHSVLDVGFGTFEEKVAKMAEEALRKMNITDRDPTTEGKEVAKMAFREAFLPVKKEVAKSWTELKPEKRDLFTFKVKTQFMDLFKDAEPKISKAFEPSHLKIYLNVQKKGETPVDILSHVLKSPLKTLGSRLHDYEDLIYMSNIFLKFREQHRRTKELSTLEGDVTVFVQ